MARTPEGAARSKPLTGLTGHSNIEPHPYTETWDEFNRWLEDYTLAAHEEVAEEGMWGVSETNNSDDEDLSDVSYLPEGTHRIIIGPNEVSDDDE